MISPVSVGEDWETEFRQGSKLPCMRQSYRMAHSDSLLWVLDATRESKQGVSHEESKEKIQFASAFVCRDLDILCENAGGNIGKEEIVAGCLFVVLRKAATQLSIQDKQSNCGYGWRR